MDDLPDELAICVLNRLPPSTLTIVACVNRRWLALAADRTLWRDVAVADTTGMGKAILARIRRYGPPQWENNTFRDRDDVKRECRDVGRLVHAKAQLEFLSVSAAAFVRLRRRVPTCTELVVNDWVGLTELRTFNLNKVPNLTRLTCCTSLLLRQRVRLPVRDVVGVLHLAVKPLRDFQAVAPLVTELKLVHWTSPTVVASALAQLPHLRSFDFVANVDLDTASRYVDVLVATPPSMSLTIRPWLDGRLRQGQRPAWRAEFDRRLRPLGIRYTLAF
jgi:hypothetical protein